VLAEIYRPLYLNQAPIMSQRVGIGATADSRAPSPRAFPLKKFGQDAEAAAIGELIRYEVEPPEVVRRTILFPRIRRVVISAMTRLNNVDARAIETFASHREYLLDMLNLHWKRIRQARGSLSHRGDAGQRKRSQSSLPNFSKAFRQTRTAHPRRPILISVHAFERSAPASFSTGHPGRNVCVGSVENSTAFAPGRKRAIGARAPMTVPMASSMIARERPLLTATQV
jgi:hypothetical protein